MKGYIHKNGKKSTNFVKKIFAMAMAFALICGTFQIDEVKAEQVGGFGRLDVKAEKLIFDGVTYNMHMGVHPSGSNETAYFVTANLKNGAVKPIVFNGTVRSLATVGQMVKYAESVGYKVLAGINADIYDTSSGTPKGTVIHDYNIVTSGYDPARVLTFNDTGDFKMALSTLHFDVQSTIGYMKESDPQPQVPPLTEGGTAPPSGTPQGAQYTEEPYAEKAAYFNVPHGAAKALHIFNEHYGSSTRTKDTSVEVVVDCGDAQLKVGNQVTGTIVSVNPAAKNTPIGKGQLVLSTSAGSPSSARLAQLVVGKPLTVNVSDSNGQLAGVKECVGLYYSIIENGAVATTGTSVNPRTALGVKADGSIVLLAVDGRQSSSAGLNLPDLANYMLSIGCVDAYNLDGGGSTTLYARMAGKDAVASRRNSPSEKNERRVANVILLVYTGSGASNTEKLQLYPANTYLIPGASAQLSLYGTNNLYEKTAPPGEASYSVSDGGGQVTNAGLFTAGKQPGTYTITATSGDAQGQTTVTVLESFTIKPSVSSVNLAPGASIDINLTTSSGRAVVQSNDALFNWSCDENIGKIDGNGVFTATSAANGAQSGKIRASYGSNSIEIPANISAAAEAGSFADTGGHWADQYIADLSKKGIINGMGGNMFMPEASLTRAQFVTLLAKLSGDDISSAASAGFRDVSAADWYNSSVNWGFASGVVKGVTPDSFAPQQKITREQMTVMICNYATYKKKMIPQSGEAKKFTDSGAISSWAAAEVVTAVGGGIINGMPDGRFQPAGFATRAQAAKVIYMLNMAIS